MPLAIIEAPAPAAHDGNDSEGGAYAALACDLDSRCDRAYDENDETVEQHPLPGSTHSTPSSIFATAMNGARRRSNGVKTRYLVELSGVVETQV